MKIHEKDASSIATSSSSPLPRRRLSKRKSVEDETERADESPNKKVQLHLWWQYGNMKINKT